MFRFTEGRLAAVLLAACLLPVACSKKPKQAPPDPGTHSPDSTPAAPPVVPSATPPAGPTAPPPAAADNPAVTRDNFKRLRRGMTPADAEQIFGPGARVPRTDVVRAIRSTGRPGRTDTTVLRWQNGRETMFLEFLNAGAVAGWYVTEKDDGTVSYDLLGAVVTP